MPPAGLCAVCHAALDPGSPACPNCGAEAGGAPRAASAANEQERDDQEKKDKKKDKVRSAWISFVGRIVAQVVGAAATVALGLLLARRMGPVAPASPPAPAAARAADRPADGRLSVAVLPLGNLSGDPGQEYFADSLTEALIAELAKIRGLRVISRTSVLQYKDARRPLPEIARELDVDVVLEGTVARAGGRVRVTAQLIDAATDGHLWAESYDRDVADVLALQAEVARAIAQRIDVTLTPQERRRLAGSAPVDPEVVSLYLKGRHEWNKRTPEGFQAALSAFERAIALAPDYAPAHAGLADTWNYLAASTFGAADPREALPKAREAAERALALDDDLGEAHASLGSVLYRYAWDFPGAERELRRAVELSPGYPQARQWLSILLAALGRGEEAVVEARRALDLDPRSPVLLRNLAVVLYFSGRLEEAEREERRAIEARQQLATFREFLAEVLLARDKAGDAAAELERLHGGPPAASGPKAIWAAAQARLGNRARAETALGELEAAGGRSYLPPRSRVVVLAALGETDRAFRVLEQAVAERSDIAHLLRAHPLLAGLRDDARFAALLRRVGLPPL